MNPGRVCFCCVLLVLLCSKSMANGPENATLIVNAESSSSKLIANFYAIERNIPEKNIIYLSGIPQQEMVTIDVFRQKIIRPILETINARKISNQIDYIIYSSDFPTIIDARSDQRKLPKAGDEASRRTASKILSPYVSINSATYFFEKILAGDPSYLSLRANTYMRADGKLLLLNPFSGDDARTFNKALQKTRADQFDKAIELFTSLAEKHPLQLSVLYWLARAHAWQGDAKQAAIWLRRSMSVGWSYRDYTKSDSAFQRIMDDAEFRSLVELIPPLPFHHGPTAGFRSSYLWGRNGMINSTSDQGNRYVLSTILAVNRNRGTNEQETLDYLRRSIRADGTKPSGKFYFTKTNNIRTKTREKGIDEAIEELKALGHDSVVVNARVPAGKFDMVGCSVGTPKFNFLNSKSLIRPGAICENLTSYGGRFMLDKTQTLLSEFLRHGAAGSSGTIVEPYAIQAKFPHPRIHVHYARGCTLAESFYQSVAGPFQLLIVGDALCRPWGNIPKLKLSGKIMGGKEINGDLAINIAVEDKPYPVRLIEMYLGGRLIQRIGRSDLGKVTVNTETMPDGYHEFRFVAVASDIVSSRGSVIAPVMINNRNQKVSLSAKSISADVEGEFKFSINAPGADRIQFFHNGRLLHNVEKESDQFSIPAFHFGRGRVRVIAIGRFDDDQYVSSRPLELEIRGQISTRIPEVRPVPAPKKKKPAAKKKGTDTKKSAKTQRRAQENKKGKAKPVDKSKANF